MCEPQIFDLIDGDDTVWENEPKERLIKREQLSSYLYTGYGQSTEPSPDEYQLEQTRAPWTVWLD